MMGTVPTFDGTVDEDGAVALVAAAAVSKVGRVWKALRNRDERDAQAAAADASQWLADFGIIRVTAAEIVAAARVEV